MIILLLSKCTSCHIFLYSGLCYHICTCFVGYLANTKTMEFDEKILPTYENIL